MGIRLILCGLIILLSYGAGILYTWRFTGRVILLRDIRQKFRTIEREILFSQNSLPDIFEKLSEEKGGFSEVMESIHYGLETSNEGFSEIWKTSVLRELKGSSLKKEQIRLISDMGRGMGFGDIEQQKKCFDRINYDIDNMIVEAEEEKKRLKKMYMSLFLFGGMGLTIVLI